jgi:triosephosphate isomerase
MHEAQSGAFTGEVSGPMLLTAGCRFVILGHSERRQFFGESDAGINRKALAALAVGLKPIVCVGETLDERESGRTHEVVERQLTGALKGLTEVHLSDVTIAYEPVWAIGTGRVATVQQAGDIHRFIRGWIAKSYSNQAATGIRIQYGGSVKADNAAELLADPDIDGALVGGASLDAEQFDRIIRSAPSH